MYNVEDVHFQEKDVTFKETMDHSKWAVTNSSDVTWTCVGDINRQVNLDIQILLLNPIALRKAKIAISFGLSECSRVNIETSAADQLH